MTIIPCLIIGCLLAWACSIFSKGSALTHTLLFAIILYLVSKTP